MDILNHLAIPAATALMLASAIVIHNYQVPSEVTSIPELSSRIANYIFDIKDAFAAHINDPALVIDSISRLLDKIFMIDTRGAGDENLHGDAGKAHLGQSKLERLMNPPTRTAVVAWIVFILSAQYIHELHQADRYQNRFLIAGLIIGFNASIVSWIISAENIFAFKTLIPASVIAALVSSALAHRFIIAKEAEKEKKDQ